MRHMHRNGLYRLTSAKLENIITVSKITCRHLGAVTFTASVAFTIEQSIDACVAIHEECMTTNERCEHVAAFAEFGYLAPGLAQDMGLSNHGVLGTSTSLSEYIN